MDQDALAVIALVVSCIALVFAAWAQVRTEQALRTGTTIRDDPSAIAGQLDDSGRVFMWGTLTFTLRGPGARYDVRPNVWPGDGVTLFPGGTLAARLDGEDLEWDRAWSWTDTVARWETGGEPIRVDYVVDLERWKRDAPWVGLVWQQPAPVYGFTRHGLRTRLRKMSERPQVWSRLLGRWVPVLPWPGRKRTPDDDALFG